MARDVEIVPKPDDAERAAIEAALAIVLEGDEDEPDAWWEAGVRAVSDSDPSA